MRLCSLLPRTGTACHAASPFAVSAARCMCQVAGACSNYNVVQLLGLVWQRAIWRARHRWWWTLSRAAAIADMRPSRLAVIGGILQAGPCRSGSV